METWSNAPSSDGGYNVMDAIYLYVKDDIKAIEWVNTNLIDCMRWQDLPELRHEHIKLSSELDIAYPTWKDAFTIPNSATADEIRSICYAEANKRKEKEMGKVKQYFEEEIEELYEESEDERSQAESEADAQEQ